MNQGSARLLITAACLMGIQGAAGAETMTTDGITLANTPETVYVSARPAAEALGWHLHWDSQSGTLYLKDTALPTDVRQERLLDGTLLIAVRDLEKLGARVVWNAADGATTVTYQDRSFVVSVGEKRVEIDRTTQRLRAWQGQTLVLQTPVSTGRAGHRTPAGNYHAGPYKSRMHYSSLYNNAPMPYSVQVNGNIFLHGYSHVPPYPASHGCIRLPLDGGNPARWFYDWVNTGTPISIVGQWSG